MKKILLIILLILDFALPCKAVQRRALVIGLGEQLDKSWAKINGDKDVPLVIEMLKTNGFNDIITLVNSAATKIGIEKAFNSLINKSHEGDIVYIQFSGHGQLMTDMNGDEADDFDEAWIPYDAYLEYCPQDHGEKHLSDDEIFGFMSRLRAKVGGDGVIAIVVDACHSGDSTRDTDMELCVVRGTDVDFVIPDKKASISDRTIMTSWLTLSACQDFQLNQEYNGIGKLTHIIVNNWQNFTGRTDLEIFNAIDSAYESRKYKGKIAQNPRLSGTSGEILSKIFNRK